MSKPLPSPPDPLPGLSDRLTDSATSYLQEISLEGEREGFGLLRRLWGEGIVGRATLLVLVVGAALTAFLITRPLADPGTFSPTLLVATILFVFGYSLTVAAATRLPLWGYVIASAYLALFGIFPFLGLPRIITTLPILWLLFCGWFVARAASGRARYLWFLLLCLGAGYLTFAGFSLNPYFTGFWNVPARLALGLVYFALFANPRTLPLEPHPVPRLQVFFGGTLLLMTALVLLAILTIPEAWVTSSLTALEFGLAFVGLLWLALSAGAFGGAVKIAEWVGGRIRPLLGRRGRVFALLAFIALVTLVEYLITQSDTLFLTLGMLLSSGVYFAAYYHVWFGVAACVLGLAAWLTNRLPAGRAAHLFGAWLGALFAMIVLFTAAVGLSELEPGAFTPLPVGAALLLIGGLVWELVKSGAGWSKASPARLYGVVALVVFTLSISAAVYGSGSLQVTLVSGLYSFYGILFIALPVLALTLASRVLGYVPADMLKLGVFFLLGWLGTVPLLLVNPYIGWELLSMPLYWFIVLLTLGPRVVPFSRPLDALVAGGALALGFVTMWMSPQSIYIPFVEPLYELQKPLEQLFLTRPLLQFEQLLFTLIALGMGLVCGVLAFYSRRVFSQRPRTNPLPSAHLAPGKEHK